MDTELLKRIRALSANDEGISGEGTRRLLAAYDALVADAQLQAAANDLNREDIEELQRRMVAAEEKAARYERDLFRLRHAIGGVFDYPRNDKKRDDLLSVLRETAPYRK